MEIFKVSKVEGLIISSGFGIFQQPLLTLVQSNLLPGIHSRIFAVLLDIVFLYMLHHMYCYVH